jgi:transcription termination factor NusB
MRTDCNSDMRKLALTRHVAGQCLKSSLRLYHLAERLRPKDELGFGYPVGEYTMSDEEIQLQDASEHASDLRDKLLESAQTLDHEIDDYITTTSAPECQELCERMQRKLPRELRDSVYEGRPICTMRL